MLSWAVMIQPTPQIGSISSPASCGNATFKMAKATLSLHLLEWSRPESEGSSTAYIRTGECSGYADGDEVTVEARGHWYGIDMMCVSDPHGGCYWIPAVDLRDNDDYSAGRR